MKKVTLREVHALRQAVTACDENAVLSLLRTFDKTDFSAESLVGYHDALLFIAAYPSSESLYREACSRLDKFASLIRRFNSKHKNSFEKLINSGIDGTEVQGAFTLPLLHQFVSLYPDSISLHSFGETSGDAGDILKPFVLPTESDLCDTDLSIEELAEKLFGRKKQLHKLVELFSTERVPETICENQFSKLNAFATLKLNSELRGRTTARLACNKPFAHKEFIRKADPVAFVNSALPAHVDLSISEKVALRRTAMCMLASLSRETDPITLSEDSDLEYFELERGVSVALFSTRASRRMPIDSYIGYMLFKNGIPLAYGGSWIFGNRALFGINIFEPFRGGESNLIILQLLRVYRQNFGIDSFSVEPYQYGKDNPEGIASGAYWFYYKLGFRSDDRQLRKLADVEMKHMKKNSEYRSSSKVLTNFTASNITWVVDASAKIVPDPAKVSAAITKNILKASDGDRMQHLMKLRQECSVNGSDSDTMLLLLEALGVDKNRSVSSAERLAELKRTSERLYNVELKKFL
ncbi:MAG: hypothetical protein L6Q81_17615 [Bacteroidia bacterium]|nr:hypothetical protein [Bacteroidia bacterium]